MVVPNFDEFTVKGLYELFKGDPDTLKYLPDLRDPPAKAPDRAYCFNVVNTLHFGYIQTAVDEALKKRNKDKPRDDRHQTL